MPMIRAPIPVVVRQHVEEAAALRNTRSFLVSAPHVKLHQLRRLDDRLAAHLDGLAVAGEYGSKLTAAALASPGPGETFTAAVRAIEDHDAVGLERLLALVEALPDGQAGLISAFGWVSASSLRGITKALLASPNAFRRQVGLAACGMHQVDPGALAATALNDADAALRVRAVHVIADRGRVDLLPCMNAMVDEDTDCAYEAARAAVLLGDRRAAIAALHNIASAPGPWRSGALGLTLKLLASTEAYAVLKALSQDPVDVRLLIHGVGVAGDPHYVPWLIQQMHNIKLTRVAGESFSFITGLDLAYLNLDRKPPENVELGPNEDPNDDSVAMDEDDSLPWPDPEKIGAWWQSNGHRFAPGTRYFMGEPPSPPLCLSVLKSGFQRQRKAAAVYLCLMNPGTPLFNCAAPAWRQQRWLDAMGA
ncbi:TIGR02270 family protein [Variovorax paradoxus]|nr:TIGR02270 family protein [Variovorax paradoxus]